MSRHVLAGACTIICVVLSCWRAQGQEYYGVPIEDGGVAFLLDVSASMAGRTEARGSADGGNGDEAWRRGTGHTGNRGSTSGRAGAQTSKIAMARTELLHALNSLRDETKFTIVTFGNRAAEWPGGSRTMGPDAILLARSYVASLSANGGTAMAEALQLGFQTSNVRTLFVVSDGRPSTAEVLGLVKRLQESRVGRRMVINTVGIGDDQDSALLCQLALDNEGIYVRDGAVACTFSPCSAGDGLVTFYPPESVQPSHVKQICSSAVHPDCTPQLVYETMLSEAQLQIPTRARTKVTNCLELAEPSPATIVVHANGLEATNYTRPGNPSHPGRIMRIVKRQGDDVVVETTGAGKLQPKDFEAVDLRLIESVYKILVPEQPAPVETAKEEHAKPEKNTPPANDPHILEKKKKKKH